MDTLAASVKKKVRVVDMLEKVLQAIAHLLSHRLEHQKLLQPLFTMVMCCHGVAMGTVWSLVRTSHPHVVPGLADKGHI